MGSLLLVFGIVGLLNAVQIVSFRWHVLMWLIAMPHNVGALVLQRGMACG